MRFIPLINSRFSTIVEDEDYNKVISLNTKWRVSYDKYGIPRAIVSTRHFEGKQIYLHRFIMNCMDDISINVDHKFGNIFDNRKEFLRLATFSQNNYNQKKHKNNLIGHKNIYLDKRYNSYTVRIRKENKTTQVGSFGSLNEAVEARNKALIELHGEFANKG